MISICFLKVSVSVSCGSKVDTFQAVIGARLRLNCGLDGSTTTVVSPTCVRGVTEALHSCSGLNRLDMEQCLATAVLRLDGDVCGLPNFTAYGPIRTTLCNTLFHIEDAMKSSVRTFCVADARPDLGCGIWRWTECIANILAVSISCGGNPRCIIANIPSSCEGCYCFGVCSKI